MSVTEKSHEVLFHRRRKINCDSKLSTICAVHFIGVVHIIGQWCPCGFHSFKEPSQTSAMLGKIGW